MIGRRLRRLGSAAEYARLDAELAVVRSDVGALTPTGGAGGVTAVEELLALAQQARDDRRRDAAWVLVQAARRHLLAAYGEPALSAHARALRVEAATKLRPWRRDAVAELLGEDDAAPTLAAVHLATLIRDEAAANDWWRIAFLRKRLFALGWMLAATLVALLAVAIAWPVPLGALPPDSGWRIWIYAALFGALGGCLSAARSVTHSLGARRIPAEAESWAVTAFRPLVGAAGGIGALVLLGNDLQTVGPMLALAFAAGFSEQFVARAVEARGGRPGAAGAAAEPQEPEAPGASPARSPS